MTGAPEGQRIGMYVTDVDGSAPKLVPGLEGWPGIAPDGQSYIVRDGNRVLRRIVSSDKTEEIPNVASPQPDERPIAWTADSQQVFTQVPVSSGANIYRFDLKSGKRELWQTIKPRDQIGLMPMNAQMAITPDGRWMAFTYSTDLTQIYRSDALQ